MIIISFDIVVEIFNSGVRKIYCLLYFYCIYNFVFEILRLKYCIYVMKIKLRDVGWNVLEKFRILVLEVMGIVFR